MPSGLGLIHRENSKILRDKSDSYTTQEFRQAQKKLLFLRNSYGASSPSFESCIPTRREALEIHPFHNFDRSPFHQHFGYRVTLLPAVTNMIVNSATLTTGKKWSCLSQSGWGRCYLFGCCSILLRNLDPTDSSLEKSEYALFSVVMKSLIHTCNMLESESIIRPKHLHLFEHNDVPHWHCSRHSIWSNHWCPFGCRRASDWLRIERFAQITVNPFPFSPAWAASTAAFRASKFICCQIIPYRWSHPFFESLQYFP